jgi:formylglycine-generating enzyme required for sulfatase activity
VKAQRKAERRRAWRWIPAALPLLTVCALSARAEEFAIQSLDKENARIAFSAVAGATNYQVLTAPTPTGVWHVAVGTVTPTTANTVTTTVSMAAATAFYRVTAYTNVPSGPRPLYQVVDLSGGPFAPSYPVTYLDAVPSGGWTDEHKTTKLVLRRIPATTPDFTMGSPSGELGRRDDETQHQVTLTKDFYIGVFEVTQRQWELVMGNNPSAFNYATYYQTLPVEQVSYYDIREDHPRNWPIDPTWPATNAVDAYSFMGMLRAKTGLMGFDLPTESQWEYACRAGTTRAYNDQTTNGGAGSDCLTTGSGSDRNLEPLAWYNANSSSGPKEVGTKQPNAWGLYDMHGNVSEWCLDAYDAYPGNVTDPEGAVYYQYQSARVIRGGCWGYYAGSYAFTCGSARRDGLGPDVQDFVQGFRVCCVPPSQP